MARVYETKTYETNQPTQIRFLSKTGALSTSSSATTNASDIESSGSTHYPQVLWPKIRSRNATAFVWAGDAIYADKTKVEAESPSLLFKRKGTPGTPSVFRRLYEEQLAQEEYNKLIKEVHILGTFDDHDYGIDNGDKNFQFKREAAIEYVETFLQFPKDSIMARRARAGQGVYGVKLFDFAREIGQEVLSDEEAGIDPAIPRLESVPYSNRSVAVFLLDIRTHKTPWPKSGMQRFFDDREGDFLGETQWEWLQEALSRSMASVNIVVNGLQVHADKYADPNMVESWSRFPTAQNRLYQVVLQSQVKRPILISGDVHHASLSQKDCASGSETRSLLEMTTSGLTHSWAVNFCPAPSRKCQSWYSRFMTKSIITIGHVINPWTEILIEEGEEGAKSGLQYTLELNFGELEFNWEEQFIQARILGVGNESPLLSLRWDMATPIHSNATTGWHCINHRGAVNPVHHAVSQVITIGILLCMAIAPTAVVMFAVAFIINRLKRIRFSALRE